MALVRVGEVRTEIVTISTTLGHEQATLHILKDRITSEDVGVTIEGIDFVIPTSGAENVYVRGLSYGETVRVSYPGFVRPTSVSKYWEKLVMPPRMKDALVISLLRSDSEEVSVPISVHINLFCRYRVPL